MTIGATHDDRQFTLDGEPVRIRDFIEDNDFEAQDFTEATDVAAQIEALQVGESMNFGGGAGPLRTLTRVR